VGDQIEVHRVDGAVMAARGESDFKVIGDHTKFAVANLG
jgi:hypothetical protein